MKEENRELVRQLYDGRRSYREIAGELSLSENTVRSRAKADDFSKLRGHGFDTWRRLTHPVSSAFFDSS